MAGLLCLVLPYPVTGCSLTHGICLGDNDLSDEGLENQATGELFEDCVKASGMRDG